MTILFIILITGWSIAGILFFKKWISKNKYNREIKNVRWFDDK